MSDDLVFLRDIIEWANARKITVARLPRLNLVIDTSCVLRDLDNLYRLRKPEARTALQELVDSGVLRLFGPTFLDREVQAKLPAFAKKQEIPLGWLETVWALYKVRVAMFPTTHVDGVSVRDPEDISFLQAQALIGADAILTVDKDIIDSSAPALTPDIVHQPLRAFARSRSMTLNIGTHTMGGVMISGEMLKGIAQAIRKRPWLALLGLGAVAGVAYWHRRQMEKKGTSAVRELGRAIVAVAQKTIERYQEAAQDANNGWSKVENALKARTPRSAFQSILSTCIWHGQAMSEADIYRDIVESADPSGSGICPSRIEVAAALRSDTRFRFNGTGWTASLIPDVPSEDTREIARTPRRRRAAASSSQPKRKRAPVAKVVPASATAPKSRRRRDGRAARRV